MTRFDPDNIHFAGFDLIVTFVNGDLRAAFDQAVQACKMDPGCDTDTDARCRAATSVARRFRDQRNAFDDASRTWMFQNTPILCALFDALNDCEDAATANGLLVDWSGHRSLLTDLCG